MNNGTTKKCPKNGFYFYKMKFEKENKGETFNKGVRDIELAALDSWKRMTLQQRDPFEEQAKNEAKKTAPKARTPKTIDKYLLSKKIASEKAIKSFNEFLSQSVFNSRAVETQEYYFIAANIFCKTVAEKYCPAELALLKFTIQDGILQTFHTHINPGTIPLGYRFEAMTLSSDTHQLPLPPVAIGEQNFVRIQKNIDKFTNAENSKRESIALFTLEEDIPMIEAICEDLYAAKENGINCHYKILSINQLFFALKTQTGYDSVGTRKKERHGNATKTIESIDDVASVLKKPLYLDDIACEFHKESDCSIYCCLSAVKQWAYAIFKNIGIGKSTRSDDVGEFPVEKYQHNSNNEHTTLLTFSKSDLHQEIDFNASSFGNPVEHWRANDLNSSSFSDFSELERLRDMGFELLGSNGRAHRRRGIFRGGNYQSRNRGGAFRRAGSGRGYDR